jgi:hypothetical protein
MAPPVSQAQRASLCQLTEPLHQPQQGGVTSITSPTLQMRKLRSHSSEVDLRPGSWLPH